MPRALVLEGPRSLRLRDEDTPDLGPRDVRVRALISGVSLGTELSIYRGSSAFAEREFDRELRAFVRPDPPRPLYPASLGYEMVGRVDAVGPHPAWTGEVPQVGQRGAVARGVALDRRVGLRDLGARRREPDAGCHPNAPGSRNRYASSISAMTSTPAARAAVISGSVGTPGDMTTTNHVRRCHGN